MYLVSVVVPVYGVEKRIERCVRSLFEQTYQNLEYIFVDDCTPDKSIDIISSVSKEYPNRQDAITIVHHARNRGLAAARNTGVEHVKGEFLCHVDSDDYLEVNAISLLVERQLESNADIVNGDAIKHRASGDVLIRVPKFTTKREWLTDILSVDNTLNHVLWGRLIRLDLYRDNGIRTKEGYNQGEDWQVMPQLAYYAKSVSEIDSVVYHYDCTNEHSLCACNGRANVQSWEQDIGSVKYLAAFFADKEPGYYRIVRDVLMLTMNSYLHLSAKFRKELFFNQLLEEMLSSRDSYATVGWNNPVVRTWDSWYLGKSVYYNVRSFGWRLVDGILHLT